MKKIGGIVLVIIIICSAATAEYATVTASLLNIRSRPSKKGFIEGFAERGDKIELSGRWSQDHKWVEVLAGEAGVGWVSIDYVTEREPVIVENLGKKVKIRKTPVNGKLTGYLKKGGKIVIDQVVLGWGHCSKGWIDLSYLIELENEVSVP